MAEYVLAAIFGAALAGTLLAVFAVLGTNPTEEFGDAAPYVAIALGGVVGFLFGRNTP